MASVVLDLVVPGTGTALSVLASIVKLCNEMKEGQDACKRLHARLADILQELQAMETSGRLPPSASLGKYTTALQNYCKFLTKYRGKKLVSRLIQSQKMMDELKALNEEVDSLMRIFNLAATGAMMQWKQQWDADRVSQQRAFSTIIENDNSVLSEVRDTRAQVEAMMQLRYQFDERQAQHNDTVIKMMQKYYNTILRASSAAVPSIPVWFIPPDEVEYDDESFAEGSFGAVHHGVWGSGTPVVIKSLLMDKNGMNEAVKEKFIDEVKIWHKLNHPNVLKLFGASHVSAPPFFVCEDAPNGNLASYLAASKANKQRMWGLLHQAALGLEYIHKNKVVHGDLKLNNILVGSDGQARVADFGLSIVRASAKSLGMSLATDATPGKLASGGALRWRAPECLKKRPTFASDVYSLAMCIIEAVSNEAPFAYLDDESVYRMLRDGEIPEKPDEMDDHAWKLVQSMTQLEPSGRISMGEVIIGLKGFAETEKMKRNAAGLCCQCDEASQVAVPGSDNCGLCHRPRVGEAETRRGELTNLSPPPSPTHMSKNRDSAPKAAAVVPLVQLLTAGGEDQKQYAVNALCDLVSRDQVASGSLIIQAGGISPLTELALNSSGTTDSHMVASAMQILRALARDERTCVAIATGNGISVLVELVRDGDDEQKQSAAFALADFLVRDGCGDAIVAANGVTPLAQLLSGGNDSQKLYAVMAISNLACTHATLPALANASVISSLLELVKAPEGSDELKLYALMALGNLAADKANCQRIAFASGVAVLLNQLKLASQEEDLKQFSLIALKHLSQAGEENCALIVQGSGISLLVMLLKTASEELAQLAATVLGCIAKHSDVHSELIASAGALGPLVELLKPRGGGGKAAKKDDDPAAESSQHCAARALACLVRENPVSGGLILKADAMPLLANMLQDGSDQQREDAAHVLRALAYDEKSCVDITDGGGFLVVFDLLQTGSATQKQAAAFAVAVVLATDGGGGGGPAGTSRRFEPLIGYLRTGTTRQQEMALEYSRKLTTETSNCLAVMRAGVLPLLIKLLRRDDDRAGSSTTGAAATTATAAQRDHAIAVLFQLAVADAKDVSSNGEAIVTAGGMEVFQDLLLHGDNPTQQALAAMALGKLGASNLPSNATIQQLILLMQSKDDQSTENAANAIARLVRTKENRVPIIRAGAVAPLVALLKTGNNYDQPKQKQYAAKALAFLAESNDAALPIEKEKIIAMLIEILRDQDASPSLSKAVAFFLANLAMTSTHALAIEENGAIPVLLDKVRTGGVAGSRVFPLLALRNLVVVNEKMRRAIAKAGAIPLFESVVRADFDICNVFEKDHAIRALGVFAATRTEYSDQLREANVIRTLVQVARDSHGSEDDPLREQAVKALSLFPGSAMATRELVLADGVPLLVDLLTTGNEAEKESAARVLSGVADGAPMMIFLKNGVPPLVKMISNGTTLSQKQRAMFVLQGMASDDETRAKLHDQEGLCSALLQMLQEQSDEKLVEVAETTILKLAKNASIVFEMTEIGITTKLEELATKGTMMQKEIARQALDVLKKAKRTKRLLSW